MNKKFRITLGLFFSFIILISVGRLVQVALGSIYDGERTPYLQMPTPNSISVRWQSELAYKGNLSVGLTETDKTISISEVDSSKEHELRIKKLKPLTRYFYSTGKKDNPKYNGPDYWFVTPPETGSKTPVRFWVTGDQGKAGKIQKKVRDGALKWLKSNMRENHAYADFWLTTGDNAYKSGTNQQFQNAFFEPYKDVLKNLAVWPAYGNHDARRWAFFDIFTLPEQGEAGGIASGTENYYSFNYANIHFVFLDSQTSDRARDDDMAKWLVDDLNANKQDWLIVIFHHPPYSEGSHISDNPEDSKGRLKEMREEIVPILEHFDADLVLTGHSHVYERSHFLTCHYDVSNTLTEQMILDKDRSFEKPTTHSPNQGTVYTVIGSSSKTDNGPLNHPVMDVSKSEAGSLVIDVVDNKLISRFIDKKGKVKDKFEIIKKHGLKNNSNRACY